MSPGPPLMPTDWYRQGWLGPAAFLASCPSVTGEEDTVFYLPRCTSSVLGAGRLLVVATLV